MTKKRTKPKTNRSYYLPNLTRLEAAIEKLRAVTASDVSKYALEGKVDTDSYDEDTRVRYLAVHFVANEIGATAPYFRNMLKVGKYESLNPIEELIVRDRQLIDVHYLFCQHRRRINASGSVFKILWEEETKTFNWKLAIEFVSTATSAKTKSDKMLAIPDDVQLELNVLRSEAVRTKRHYLNDKSQLLTKRLFEQQGKPSSRMSEVKVRAMVKDIFPLLLAAGSPKKSVEYKCLMNGLYLSKKEMLAEVKQVGEHKRWFNAGYIGKINWKVSSESEEDDKSKEDEVTVKRS